MLLPEPMSKILVVGTKRRLPDTIDLLYSLENVHVIDFTAGQDDFSLGAPLPEASDASHKLLKLRSAEKDLDVVDDDSLDKVPVSQIRGGLDVSIAELETEVMSAVSSKNAKQVRLNELENRLAQLEPYKSIPLSVDMYEGYDNLDVIAGTVRSDPEPALREALGGEYELFTGGRDFIVLFVSAKQAEEAQRILSQSGYVGVPLPTGTGLPEEEVASLTAQIAEVKAELDAANQAIVQLNEKYASTILASDEYLSIVVEKAELPLRMGASAHSFVLEAWVPTASYEKISGAFTDKFGDAVHLELLETKGRREHHEHPEDIALESGMSTVAPEGTDDWTSSRRSRWSTART